jgi:hypothetical protein
MSMKFALPAAAVVALISTSAFAATLTKTGAIKSIDRSHRQLVLTSGETFKIGHWVHAKRLKVGENVSISYKVHGGREIAKSVHRVM